MTDKEQTLQDGLEAFDTGDYARSFSLLLPLAQMGMVKAQCFVGTMYFMGWGVAVDGPKAVEWYRKAAEQRVQAEKLSATAYNSLATIFCIGLPGVPVDRHLARECWRKAHELGFEMIPKTWYEDDEVDGEK